MKIDQNFIQTSITNLFLNFWPNIETPQCLAFGLSRLNFSETISLSGEEIDFLCVKRAGPVVVTTEIHQLTLKLDIQGCHGWKEILMPVFSFFWEKGKVNLV